MAKYIFFRCLRQVIYCSPSERQVFLRLLLINVRGPTSFEYLRTVDGQICETYREACQKLQLLENDEHWEMAIAESSVVNHPRQIRTLFAIILVTCSPSNPKLLWNKFKESMAEDILHRYRVNNNDATLEYSDIMFNECLILLEDKCLQINNKTLIEVGLTSPIRSGNDQYDRDLLRESTYNLQELGMYLEENLPRLQEEQKMAYEKIMEAISNQCGGFYFLDAPGGTGKTFLISLILAKIRSENNIALAIASSGIAATLLDGGRTAHSALKLPLNMQFSEDYTCIITKN